MIVITYDSIQLILKMLKGVLLKATWSATEGNGCVIEKGELNVDDFVKSSSYVVDVERIREMKPSIQVKLIRRKEYQIPPEATPKTLNRIASKIYHNKLYGNVYIIPESKSNNNKLLAFFREAFAEKNSDFENVRLGDSMLTDDPTEGPNVDTSITTSNISSSSTSTDVAIANIVISTADSSVSNPTTSTPVV